MFKDRQSGVSLVGVLVASVLLGFVALGISQLMSNSFRGSASMQLKESIISLQRTVRTRLDCNATLGVPALPTIPLACASYANLPLKDKSGNDFSSMGGWTLKTSCAGNSLIVSATRPGTDPMTGKLKNQMQTGPGIVVENDLFGGTGQFCSSYFTGVTTASCAPPSVIASVNFATNSVVCAKGPFGGIYAQGLGGYCWAPNPYTNACSCPLGYAPKVFHGWQPNQPNNFVYIATSSTGASPSYFDLNKIFYNSPPGMCSGPSCGLRELVCMP